MKFQRNPIDSSTRLEIGYQVAQNKGVYGSVTRLAELYAVSRWFIYFACYSLWLSALHYAQSVTSGVQERFNSLNVEFQILCLYLETCSSLEGIQRVLERFSGHRIGMGRISEILTKVGRRLPVSDRDGQGMLWLLVVDEIFCQGDPLLIAVDPHSLYIYTIRRVKRCDGATW